MCVCGLVNVHINVCTCMHTLAHMCTHSHHFEVHLCVEMSPLPCHDNDLEITASPPIPTSPARVKT